MTLRDRIRTHLLEAGVLAHPEQIEDLVGKIHATSLIEAASIANRITIPLGDVTTVYDDGDLVRAQVSATADTIMLHSRRGQIDVYRFDGEAWLTDRGVLFDEDWLSPGSVAVVITP